MPDSDPIHRGGDTTRKWPAHPSKTPFHNSADMRGGQGQLHVDRPDRHEFWTLKPGEKKIERKVDTRTANTEEFIIRAEDHTMGNLIREALLKMPEVTFAAYKCPHPLDNRVIIRIQCNPDSDLKPVDAFRTAIDESIKELQTFLDRFRKSYNLTKMSQEAQGPVNGA
ncbi:DNA-directed RNA polymerase II subunit RPB11 [Cyphellophora attinorum]|uniref:DNA-directed RNA polymerase II subunit RPB11 n=1 Tax=Cyphellophora attinorum TaxID=1664694 RepID=A0A0N1H2B6_9EURO|nr:DNA-directed RNA polymerase II subunit RPB11 [Phialophora attinorum]KPI35310.1 DNA-directed RNA polymerase II subunit RPB11 [Phialophora attinorum]